MLHRVEDFTAGKFKGGNGEVERAVFLVDGDKVALGGGACCAANVNADGGGRGSVPGEVTVAMVVDFFGGAVREDFTNFVIPCCY